MASLEELLGIDYADPETARAAALVEADRALLRRLVELRKELDLSQKDVADRLGLQQPTITAFERYDSDPKLSTIRRYAQAVGLLIAHHVEIDHGQAVRDGVSWASGWTSPGPTTVSSPIMTQPAVRTQLPVDSNRADFAMAA